MSRLLSPLSADDIPEIRGLAAQYSAPGKAKTKPAIPGECFLSLRIAESSAGLLPLTHIDVLVPTLGLFYKPRTSLTGPETPIIIPRSAKGESSDYEVEICVVIGKPGRDIPVEKAYDHVLGYMTVNDVSPWPAPRSTHADCHFSAQVTCRGVLAKVPQPGMGKSFDSESILIPLVTRSLTRDARSLSLRRSLDSARTDARASQCTRRPYEPPN